MELPEPISWVNKRLQDEYGYQELNRPFWRVVFSEDEFEKRLGTYVDYDQNTGAKIREVTEVREVPKYRQWIQGKYILERLTVVPVPNIVELLGQQYSYEPVWVFENTQGEAVPPLFRACRFVIKTVLAQAARAVGAKYKDPDAGLTTKQQKEKKAEELAMIEKDLFGDETAVGKALMTDSAVGYGVRKRNDSKIIEVKR